MAYNIDNERPINTDKESENTMNIPWTMDEFIRFCEEDHLPEIPQELEVIFTEHNFKKDSLDLNEITVCAGLACEKHINNKAFWKQMLVIAQYYGVKVEPEERQERMNAIREYACTALLAD